MTNRLLCLFLAGLLIAGLIALPDSAPACPFCGTTGGSTLTDDVNQASMVLYGTLTNAQPGGADFNGGSTDLIIEAVVKKHDILGDKKVITLPRYVPITDKNNKVKYLIFCDVFKGKVDPYKGLTMKSDDIVKYLSGAIALKNKDVGTRLRFFFDFLDNADTEISNDAFKEFANADYKDYRDMAKNLPGDKVVKWLEDPNTPSYRYGTYASLLGHCGKPEQAEVLRKMLDDPQKRVGTGVDGILAGYTLLKPKEGWECTRGILGDPKKEFMVRYAALRSARFFWELRPDVIDKKKIKEDVCLLLDQSDIADLGIEDLRKWKQFDVLGRVLALNDKSSHNIPIIRRSILRFALSCQDLAPAAEFIKAERQKDAEKVKDVEELLKLEAPSNPTPAVAK
jgi:hypothetical protein